MSYRYECDKCELTSESYARRRDAEEVGKVHRAKRHERMYVKGEGILTEPLQLPSGDDLRKLGIGLLILVALIVGSHFM